MIAAIIMSNRGAEAFTGDLPQTNSLHCRTEKPKLDQKLAAHAAADGSLQGERLLHTNLVQMEGK